MVWRRIRSVLAKKRTPAFGPAERECGPTESAIARSLERKPTKRDLPLARRRKCVHRLFPLPFAAQPHDWSTYATAVGLLASVAFVAALISTSTWNARRLFR